MNRVLLLGLLSVWTMAAGAREPAGLRGWVVRELTNLEDKLTKLAKAVPQAKHTWRPGEGVRSVSEVYLHVAAGNFNYARLLGVPPPAGMDLRGLEKSTTEQRKVVELLKQSFEQARQAVNKVSDADLEKPLESPGRWRINRDVMMVMVTHGHEHLGQSIAYARMNSVVPPWTEEFQRPQPQKQAPPKK